MVFDYYSVDFFEGDLVLKMKPDKAWMKLEPTSQTEFFHLSCFDHFDITFLPDENGEVNGFIFINSDGGYEFYRIADKVQEQEEETQPETFWSIFLYRIRHFSGTNAFKFLAIILGLIFLQVILQYLRSLLA